jgi:AcrR family transcriptional regulator
LDAADRLLAPFGNRKMTIDDLAQKVEIGKVTVYLHFLSKEKFALFEMDVDNPNGTSKFRRVFIKK